MAEYKTYKCDICGSTEAHHIVFPNVDYTDDPADNYKRRNVSGHIDLCTVHLLDRLRAYIINLPRESQQKLWKTWWS